MKKFAYMFLCILCVLLSSVVRHSILSGFSRAQSAGAQSGAYAFMESASLSDDFPVLG